MKFIFKGHKKGFVFVFNNICFMEYLFKSNVGLFMIGQQISQQIANKSQLLIEQKSINPMRASRLSALLIS